jgi:uncharacterized repeat protein (TIGR03803 family)
VRFVLTLGVKVGSKSGQNFLKKTDAMRLTAVVAMLALGPLRLPAQTTTSLLVLHTFTAPSGQPVANNDGAHPAAGLVLSGNTLFGTTAYGGAAGYGTVFQVNTDGSDFTTLYSFTNGTDGATPMAPLLVAGGMLYGTASAGGSSNDGTIFMLDTAGSNFSTLYTFTNGEDGAAPAAGLLLAGSTLYGTTAGTSSGSSFGTMFMMNTNGSAFGLLHRFSAPISNTNSDGILPSGPLILLEGLVYGTATDGGSHGTGTLFEADAGGSNFGSFYTFAATSGFPPSNGNGAYPQGGLVSSGNALYGAAQYGGSNGWGTVYQYDVGGSGFSPLYSFTGGEDYLNPQGPLTLSSNMIYGTTPATIFGLTTNGTDFTNLFSFPFTTSDGLGDYTNATGFDPNGGLVPSGQSFFGTALDGGTNGYGTVFAFNFFPAPAPLTIQQASNAVILTWPNSVFALQSAPSLAGPFTNVPSATSPYTNILAGSQMFFRLLFAN